MAGVSAVACTHNAGIGRMSAPGANRTCRDGGNDVTHSGHRDAFAERTLWNVGPLAVSLRLDAGELDHLAPLLGFVRDQLAEVGGRARQRRTPHVGKARL